MLQFSLCAIIYRATHICAGMYNIITFCIPLTVMIMSTVIGTLECIASMCFIWQLLFVVQLMRPFVFVYCLEMPFDSR